MTETMKIIQINTKPKVSAPKYDNKGHLVEGVKVLEEGKSFFFATEEDCHLFLQENPNLDTESFNVELPKHIAQKYLNTENKKQFERKEVLCQKKD